VHIVQNSSDPTNQLPTSLKSKILKILISDRAGPTATGRLHCSH
jgi:hypothetical protein